MCQMQCINVDDDLTIAFSQVGSSVSIEWELFIVLSVKQFLYYCKCILYNIPISLHIYKHAHIQTSQQTHSEWISYILSVAH